MKSNFQLLKKYNLYPFQNAHNLNLDHEDSKVTLSRSLES